MLAEILDVYRWEAEVFHMAAMGLQMENCVAQHSQDCSLKTEWKQRWKKCILSVCKWVKEGLLELDSTYEFSKKKFIFWLLLVQSQVKPIGLNCLNAFEKKEERKKDSDNKTCINFSLILIYTQAVIYHASSAKRFLTGAKCVVFTNLANLYGDKGRFNNLNANRKEVKYEINKMEVLLSVKVF